VQKFNIKFSDSMTTESRVKLIRKELKLTQEQLAQRLGIGKAALSMIETGKCGLSMRNKNIIVQGVAGSGKTSIALHRAAFLLYQNKRKKQ
jgi:transcriptional regulator with XRE-family HTH domain